MKEFFISALKTDDEIQEYFIVKAVFGYPAGGQFGRSPL
jgi:hypothetical protein